MYQGVTWVYVCIARQGLKVLPWVAGGEGDMPCRNGNGRNGNGRNGNGCPPATSRRFRMLINIQTSIFIYYLRSEPLVNNQS